MTSDSIDSLMMPPPRKVLRRGSPELKTATKTGESKYLLNHVSCFVDAGLRTLLQDNSKVYLSSLSVILNNS